MRHRRTPIALAALLGAWLSGGSLADPVTWGAAAQAALPPGVELRLSSRQIAVDELLQVEIISSGSVRVGDPEGKDFLVVSRGSSTSMSFGFGQQKIERATTLNLRPTRTGTLTLGRIPVVTEAGTVFSDPIEITVTASDPNAPRRRARDPLDPFGGLGQLPPMPGMPPMPPMPGLPPPMPHPGQPAAPPAPPATTAGVDRAPAPASEAMLTTGIPSDATGPVLVAYVSDPAPVVGEQFIVDFVLFKPVMSGPAQITDLTEPAFEGLWYQDISQQRQQMFGEAVRSRSVGQTVFEGQVIRSYLVVPLKEGATSVPAAQIHIQMGFGRRVAEGDIASAAIPLQVGAVPRAQGDPDPRGRVGRFEVKATVDRPKVRAGETVLVHVEVAGVGVFSNFELPRLPAFPRTRAGTPTEDRDQALGNSGWLEGRAGVTFPLVPTAEGTIEIPSLAVAAYDPWKQRIVPLETAPLQVVVEGMAPIAQEAHAEEGSGAAWKEALPAARPTTDAPGRLPAASLPGPVAWALVGAPPVLVLLTWLGRVLVRRRQAAAPERRRRSAAADALRILAERGPTPVRDALTGFIEARFSQPARGRSIAQLEQWAGGRLGTDAAARLAALLRDAESARFSGEPVEALAERARAWIEEVDHVA
jgi:hypothetical protein